MNKWECRKVSVLLHVYTTTVGTLRPSSGLHGV